eukprot:TRINITY_DN760_c0_g2_i1.p1 TRINITY_DN760_c0_g2~~TRINITY_DN760_c0_g2_i1.p1  ORF type:complete len:678 (-),score=135.60 TRINITY_DN760_c0_g2_i1:148-2181(-)
MLATKACSVAPAVGGVRAATATTKGAQPLTTVRVHLNVSLVLLRSHAVEVPDSTDNTNDASETGSSGDNNNNNNAGNDGSGASVNGNDASSAAESGNIFSCSILVEYPLTGTDLRQAMLNFIAVSPLLPARLQHSNVLPALWIKQLVHEYNVEVVLPHHARLLSQYSRCKSHALLLNRRLFAPFFRMLGETALELRIAEKRQRYQHTRVLDPIIDEERKRKAPSSSSESSDDSDYMEAESTCPKDEKNKEQTLSDPPAHDVATPTQAGVTAGNRGSGDCAGSTVDAERSVVISFSPAYITPKLMNPTTMSVIVDVNWRMSENLSRDDIYHGFSMAKCYRPNSAEELTCRRCVEPNESVIRVTPKECTLLPSIPRRECYSFSVNSLCSSSTSHMNCSHVVLNFQLKHVKVQSTTPIRLRARLPSVKVSPTKSAPCTPSFPENQQYTPTFPPARCTPSFPPTSCTPASCTPTFPGTPPGCSLCTPGFPATPATPARAPATPCTPMPPMTRLCQPMSPLQLCPQSPSSEFQSNSFGAIGGSETLFVASPQLHSLAATTPLCVIVLILRHTPYVCSRDWHAALCRCFENAQTLPDTAPLCFKSMMLSGLTAQDTLSALGPQWPMCEQPEWWYTLQVACYPLNPASLLPGYSLAAGLARSLGVGYLTDHEAQSQVVAAFCSE